MKKPFIVDVRPVRSEKLTPQEYLRLQAESPTLIERAEFLPPGIGAQGFGAFFVRYTRARWAADQLQRADKTGGHGAATGGAVEMRLDAGRRGSGGSKH